MVKEFWSLLSISMVEIVCVLRYSLCVKNVSVWWPWIASCLLQWTTMMIIYKVLLVTKEACLIKYTMIFSIHHIVNSGSLTHSAVWRILPINTGYHEIEYYGAGERDKPWHCRINRTLETPEPCLRSLIMAQRVMLVGGSCPVGLVLAIRLNFEHLSAGVNIC